MPDCFLRWCPSSLGRNILSALFLLFLLPSLLPGCPFSNIICLLRWLHWVLTSLRRKSKYLQWSQAPMQPGPIWPHWFYLPRLAHSLLISSLFLEDTRHTPSAYSSSFLEDTFHHTHGVCSLSLQIFIQVSPSQWGSDHSLTPFLALCLFAFCPSHITFKCTMSFFNLFYICFLPAMEETSFMESGILLFCPVRYPQGLDHLVGLKKPWLNEWLNARVEPGGPAGVDKSSEWEWGRELLRVDETSSERGWVYTNPSAFLLCRKAPCF